MTISSLYSSKKSPALSSKKKKAPEIKKKLLKKKVILPNRTNKVENGDNKKVQMCIERKGQKHNSAEIHSSAQLRAKIFQATLPSRFPSFVKCMLPSNVARGYSLSFPSKFCDFHFPKHDAIVVLVDENEEEYAINYLGYKNGLSGGWSGFSMAHNLVENDVLVFHLIQHCKFEVYILRENRWTYIDGAVLAMDFCDREKRISKPLHIVSHVSASINDGLQ